MATFGFIGTGNMGGALAAAAAKVLPAGEILLHNRTMAKAEALAARLGCPTGSLEQTAREAKYLFLGVKPQMMAGMLASIAPVLASRQDRFILVTMAAGLTMERIASLAGGDYPVIRIMPNTPVGIGEGVILYCDNAHVTPQERQFFLDAMAMGGMIDILDEHLIDAGSAVAGCGGAFCDLFLEALSDGGVACGLPRAKALRYAGQMMAGAAKLMLETGLHPGALKDQVCSPGGSTIQGVRALEDSGFRGAVMEAVIAAFEKTVELGK